MPHAWKVPLQPLKIQQGLDTCPSSSVTAVSGRDVLGWYESDMSTSEEELRRMRRSRMTFHMKCRAVDLVLCRRDKVKRCIVVVSVNSPSFFSMRISCIVSEICLSSDCVLSGVCMCDYKLSIRSFAPSHSLLTDSTGCIYSCSKQFSHSSLALAVNRLKYSGMSLIAVGQEKAILLTHKQEKENLHSAGDFVAMFLRMRCSNMHTSSSLFPTAFPKIVMSCSKWCQKNWANSTCSTVPWVRLMRPCTAFCIVLVKRL